MGNFLQVVLYACPAAEAYLVADVLVEHGLRHHGRDDDRIVLGEVYSDRNGGTAEDLAEALTKAAPGAAFRAWTDPTDEGLGGGVLRTPALGSFEFASDESGEPLFAVAAIEAALREDAPVHLMLGAPWRDALRDLERALPRDQAGRTVITPTCSRCDDLAECPQVCPHGDPLCQHLACENHDDCEQAAHDEELAHAMNAGVNLVAV